MDPFNICCPILGSTTARRPLSVMFAVSFLSGFGCVALIRSGLPSVCRSRAHSPAFRTFSGLSRVFPSIPVALLASGTIRTASTCASQGGSNLSTRSSFSVFPLSVSLRPVASRVLCEVSRCSSSHCSGRGVDDLLSVLATTLSLPFVCWVLDVFSTMSRSSRRWSGNSPSSDLSITVTVGLE